MIEMITPPALVARGGSGAAASRARDDDAPDHDDGEEDDALRKANYYTVSAQQRAFNEEKMCDFVKTAANLSHSYFDPPDVSKSGCNPAYIGVGRVHVHAPHLFLGFAKPPCPTCGWKSVDQDTVKSWGVCPARRVYAAEMDEWVAGQLMLCTVCKQGSDRLKGEWEELRESYQDDKASEVTEAKAAWKARTSPIARTTRSRSSSTPSATPGARLTLTLTLTTDPNPNPNPSPNPDQVPTETLLRALRAKMAAAGWDVRMEHLEPPTHHHTHHRPHTDVRVLARPTCHH